MRTSVGEAFRNLYSAAYEPLLVYATRLAGASMAEDIVQEVFVRVLRYRGEQLDLVTLPYLRAIARNVAMTMFSRRGIAMSLAAGEMPEPAARRSENEPVEREESPRRGLVRTLDDLPERQREVLILTECHGLSESQAGVALSISKAAVGSRRRLALDSLRRRVERPAGQRRPFGHDEPSGPSLAYGRTA